MAKRLTKKQIKIIAKMHAGMTLRATDANAFDDCGISEQENENILSEVHKIANSVLSIYPDSLASSEDIIKYVRTIK